MGEERTLQTDKQSSREARRSKGSCLGQSLVPPLHFLSVWQEEQRLPGLWAEATPPKSFLRNREAFFPDFHRLCLLKAARSAGSLVHAVRRPSDKSEHQPIHLTPSKQPLPSPWVPAGTSWGQAEHRVTWEEGRARTGAWEGFLACVGGGAGGGCRCWELFSVSTPVSNGGREDANRSRKFP